MKDKNIGAIYLAFGEAYLAMALNSIKYLKENNTGFPVCILTNIEFDITNFHFLSSMDTVTHIDLSTENNRDIKTRIYDYSPYEYSIFIDCDTIVFNDLRDAALILNYFDVAFRLNRYPQTRKGKGDINVLQSIPISVLPHWNSGVILFRKSELANDFFQQWNENYKKIGVNYDQVSLVETIFKTNARVLSLDEKWNSVDPILNRKKWRKTAKIFHCGTNISDKMISETIDLMSLTFNENQLATVKNVLKRKRTQKKAQGIIKYNIAKIVWKFWPPY